MMPSSSSGGGLSGVRAAPAWETAAEASAAAKPSVEGVRIFNGHSKRDAARLGRRARHCDRAMPMPAAAAAAAPTPLGNAPPTTPSNAVDATICALFFQPVSRPRGRIAASKVTTDLRPGEERSRPAPLRARKSPPVWGARGRSARLFQRLLEQRPVGNHAVQVAAQRGQRGAEVAEREPTAQLGEPARVLLEEVREHGQRHQLEATQVDHDALGRAAERSAHARDELPRRARVDRALEANHEGGARVVAPRPRAQPGAPHLHAARRHRPDQGRDERHSLADADGPGEHAREAHGRRRLARRLAHDRAPQAVVGDQGSPAVGADDARAPPDGAMAVEHPRGPGEAAPELVWAHGTGALLRREAREGDAAGGREPYRTGEDAGVIALAPQRQVRHGEEPRTADAPERPSGGAERARLARLAHQRVRLGAEDERAAAAPPCEPQETGLTRDGELALRRPGAGAHREVAAEEPRVGHHLAEAVSGEQDASVLLAALGGHLGRGTEPARRPDQRHAPPREHAAPIRNLAPALQPPVPSPRGRVTASRSGRTTVARDQTRRASPVRSMSGGPWSTRTRSSRRSTRASGTSPGSASANSPASVGESQAVSHTRTRSSPRASARRRSPPQPSATWAARSAGSTRVASTRIRSSPSVSSRMRVKPPASSPSVPPSVTVIGRSRSA